MWKAQRLISGVVKPGKEAQNRGVGEHVHALLLEERTHYHTVGFEGRPFMQVLLTVARDGAPIRYFEGIHEVSAETFDAVKTGSKAEWLAGAGEVVEFHREKFDGSGCRKGVRGEAIPLNARIFAIADVSDALVSKRPYKEPVPFERAMQQLRRGRGTHFDPRPLDAFEPMAAELYAHGAGADAATLEDTLRRLVRMDYTTNRH